MKSPQVGKLAYIDNHNEKLLTKVQDKVILSHI